MARGSRVVFLGLLALMETLWMSGPACGSDPLTPTAASNETLSHSGNATSAGAVVGRVAVIVGVAGVVGLALFVLRKKRPKGSNQSRHTQGLELRRTRREAAPSRGGASLNADQSASSVPLLQSHKHSHRDAGPTTST